MFAATTLAFAAAVAAQQPSISDLLDRYLAGDHAVAVQQLTEGGDEGDRLRGFRLQAGRWIAADPIAALPRRRAAVALALEVAAAEMLHAWVPCTELLDWAATELRKEPPSAFEATWIRAAAALGFRAQDVRWLVNPGFLSHAVSRHPNDPHLLFVSGAARLTPPPAGLATIRDEDIHAMVVLTGDAVVGVDAELQLAQHYLLMQTYDRALHHAWRAVSRATAPQSVYLARFIAGRALEGKGDATAAVAEYEQALTALPGAQSATLALAALETSRGDASRGLGRTERAFAGGGPADRADPWRLLPYGEFGRLAELITQVRKALK